MTCKNKAFLNLGHQHIRTDWRGWTTTNPMAKAGFTARIAGQADDGQTISFGLVVGIRGKYRIKWFVKRGKASGVAWAAAKNNRGLSVDIFRKIHFPVIFFPGLPEGKSASHSGKTAFLGETVALAKSTGIPFLPGAKTMADLDAEGFSTGARTVISLCRR